MSAKAAPVKRSRWLDWNPKTQISADSAGGEPTKPTKPGFVGFVGATSEESAEIEGTASRGAVHSDRVPSRVRIFADSPENEATKPSKPSSVGFVGATSAESHEIWAGASVGGDSPCQPSGSGISGNPHETEPPEPPEPPEPDSVGFVGATHAESSEIDAKPGATELARASEVLNRAGVRLMQLEGVVAIGIWSDLDGPELRKALRTFGSEQLPIRYLDGSGVPARYKLRRVAGEPVPMNVLTEMERHPDEPWKVRDRMLREMGWGSQATSWAEWKAGALNRLFQEQGVTGRPGRITAATVLHGERKRQRRDSILAASAKSEPTKPTKPPLEKG